MHPSILDEEPNLELLEFLEVEEQLKNIIDGLGSHHKISLRSAINQEIVAPT